MDSSKGLCPHQSIPVEMDERMTSSSLNLDWLPSCKQCHKEDTKNPEDYRVYEPPRESCHPAAGSSGMRPHHPADIWTHVPRGLGPQYVKDPMSDQRLGAAGPSDWPRVPSMEGTESLERPYSLVSYDTYTPPYPHGSSQVQGSGPRQCPCCPPPNRLNNNNHYYPNNPHYPAGPRPDPQHMNLLPQHKAAPLVPRGHDESQCVMPQRELIQEVSVSRSIPAGIGGGRGGGGRAGVTREVRKTISLPEECRNLFITYSVDTAEEILPFVTFLSDHGFKPSIDLFDNPMRRMGINKWMDRFLNDKSVLIIVVISPKYREDVEGDGDEEHGLHTKYIHNQIQNEFIQQGCLNFRLVPVLFPNATKQKHVPQWLRSTRIYRWPQDTEDLLLRLLREERYIIPQRGPDLTITVRPLSK